MNNISFLGNPGTDGTLTNFYDKPAKRIGNIKSVVSSLFTFSDFRSSDRRRFALQLHLIVINGGTDEIF